MATALPNGFEQPLIDTAGPFRPTQSTPPLRAAVEVKVRDLSGEWPVLEFVVDSGAGVTSIPWLTATCCGIPIGNQRVRSNLITATGPVQVEAARHTIEIEFVQLPGRTFVIDCEFRAGTDNVPAVLGIGGNVLRQLDIRFDGRPRPPHAPYGFVVIEVQTPAPTHPTAPAPPVEDVPPLPPPSP
jgi:hypothetical protein